MYRRKKGVLDIRPVNATISWGLETPEGDVEQFSCTTSSANNIGTGVSRIGKSMTIDSFIDKQDTKKRDVITPVAKFNQSGKRFTCKSPKKGCFQDYPDVWTGHCATFQSGLVTATATRKLKQKGPNKTTLK